MPSCTARPMSVLGGGLNRSTQRLSLGGGTDQVESVYLIERKMSARPNCGPKGVGHRWQPGILKAIRRVFGERYAGVGSTG